ncbi:MAG: metallophosphoesterase, partial [Ferruginibacter sp.]|nr:metallophosphoesterase [Chitinophagaceae bacterium]
MKKHIVLIGGLLLLNLSLRAQEDTLAKRKAHEDTISQRIVLIGDAGQLTNGRHPVVNAVRRLITLDNKTTVFFLGDNLYKVGLPDQESQLYPASRAVLDSQLSVVEGTPSKAFMIPGNHDWQNGGRNGYDAVTRQQLYVDFLRKPNIKYLPEDGCPGPIEVSIGTDITVIVFDSQWWLHPHDKPGIESDCQCKTKEELVTQIEEIASRNSKKLILLACHHPFKSNGTHGGYYILKQHIFPLTDMKPNLYIPLPVIGSAYPIARSVFGTPQDLKHPIYANMITEISAAVKAIPNLIFVAGHDHNLQHIKDSNHHYIVSGGGCKINRTSKAKNSLFNSSSTGFSVMEISRNKNVTINFYTVSDSASAEKVYSASLLNFSKIPDEALDTSAHIVDDPFLKYKDTFTIAGSKDFPVIKGVRRFFMGQNYRPEWSTPVNMKVFNLTQAGFIIKGLGGGKQTKSLQLEDKKGKIWVLRSLNKSTTKAIPEAFRGNFVEDLVTELNSASHPYGALTFPALAKPLNLNVPKPILYFVPDDPALGFYRPLFANNVCMLEEKNGSPDGADTKTTAKVLDKMLDENDHRPEQQDVLRARLLDMVTGDFDRHFDQWRWGTFDTGKGKVYYPIPRDRDQAYFYSDGAILKFISNRAMPFLKGFRSTIPKVNWLGYSARDFDRIFLTTLDEKKWKETIAEFREGLTDSVIRNAVKKLPPEIFAFGGEKMIKKLISRRNRIEKEAMTYYRFISEKVNVVGSNQKEYFKISNHGEGLQVRVYARAKGNDTSFIMFDRIFLPSVTREIHLYGLNDDDLFDIEENASSRIKLRIIGGKGNDTFDIR